MDDSKELLLVEAELDINNYSTKHKKGFQKLGGIAKISALVILILLASEIVLLSEYLRLRVNKLSPEQCKSAVSIACKSAKLYEQWGV